MTKKSLAKPTYSRVITVRPVKSIFETLEYVDDSFRQLDLALKKKQDLILLN